MNKKILLWVLSLVLLSSFVSADIFFNAQFEDSSECDGTYWTEHINPGDGWIPIQSTTAYNGTYSCHGDTGSNTGGYDYHDMNYDGTTDGINLSIWVRADSSQTLCPRLATAVGGTDQVMICLQPSVNANNWVYFTGSGWVDTGVAFTTSTWHNVNYVRDGNDIKGYLNNQLIFTAGRTSKDMSILIQQQGTDGYIDNVIAYNGTLSPAPTSGNFTITANINTFNATLGEEISLDVSSEYACSPYSCFNYTSPIDYYLNTEIQLGDNRYNFDSYECTTGNLIEITKDTDLSSNVYYYCDSNLITTIPSSQNQTIGDLYIDRAFNTTTGSITTNVLNNDTNLYNVTFIADKYYSVTYFNYNVSNNLNYNFPFFNVEAVNNQTQANINNFDVIIDGNWTYNVTNGLVPIYINQSTVNISVFSDGYLTYSDTAHNTSNNLEAQMYNYSVNITFYDTNSSLPYNNSNITIFYPSGYSEILTTNENGTIYFDAFVNGLNEVGNYNFQVNSKTGYITPTNISATINQSNLPYNNTYGVDRAFFNITIRDVQTGQLLTQNATVTIGGVGQYTTNTGNLIIRDSSIEAGNYVITTFVAGYDLNTRNVDYTAQEEERLTISMVNETGENIGDWIVTVLDPFYNEFLGADTRLLEYDPANDVYNEIDSCITNSNGRCVYSVEIGIKKYVVTASGDIEGLDYFAQSSESGEVIYFDQDTVNLFLNLQTQLYVSPDLDLDIWYYNETLVNATGGDENANLSYLSAQFLDSEGNSHEVCIDYYYIEGLNKELATTVCASGSSGIVKVMGGYILDRSYTWIAEITLVKTGGEKEVVYSFTYQKEDGLEFQLGILSRFLIILILILMLVISLWLKNILIFGVGTIAVQPFIIAMLPSYWDWKIASVIIVLSIVLIYLTRKTESLQSV